MASALSVSSSSGYCSITLGLISASTSVITAVNTATGLLSTAPKETENAISSASSDESSR